MANASSAPGNMAQEQRAVSWGSAGARRCTTFEKPVIKRSRPAPETVSIHQHIQGIAFSTLNTDTPARRFVETPSIMSTINMVRYYFYKGRTPLEAHEMQRLIALAYRTAQDRQLYPKAVLIRYIILRTEGR